jgi:hypothetical protein
MKKTVIFHIHYEGAKNNGNRTHKMSYHVLTSKNKITNDFFEWMKKEHKAIAEEIGENPAIVDLKIVGL